MSTIRTSRSYAKLPDLDVSKFAGKVVDGLTDNPVLPMPPVMPVEVTALKNAFDDAIIAADKGSALAYAQKEAARVALITALTKDASYVDINCNDDLTILLSSGYKAVGTNRSQAVLAAPQITRVGYGQTGEIRLGITGDPNRRAIQGRCKTVDGEWGPVITFKSSREILFKSLSAGTTYVMQLIGLGGSTGQSDWSESVTKIAV